MKKIITLILIVTLSVAVQVANADFTFGESTNLGPEINGPGEEAGACLSPDGLELYFHCEEPDGEIRVARRASPNDQWGSSSNLGPTVNSPGYDGGPCLSADGLRLYFFSTRSGGYGNWDLWVTTKATVDDNWNTPVNLGQTINTSTQESWPSISPDPLMLFFASNRSGGLGSWELYMARRATTKDPWGPSMNLGPMVNSTTWEAGVKVSNDGSMLYFNSPRPSGFGASDIWQAPIESIVDLNTDGIVDSADMCIIVDHWGTDELLCDIGPMPWGDGIVDVQDLIVLAEHLFEEIPPAEEVE